MKRWQIAVTVALAVGLGTGALMSWVFRADLQAAMWTWSASRPLSGAQLEALERCEDPGWIGVLRALSAPAPEGCEADAVARLAAVHAQRGPRRAWLQHLAAHAGQPPTVRVHAALALMWAGEPVAADVSILLSDPALDARLRQVVVQELVEGELPSGWEDPGLALEVDVARALAGASIAPLGTWLDLEALVPRAPAEQRAAVVRAVLDAHGLPLAAVTEARAQRHGGSPITAVAPAHLDLVLATRCRAYASPACVDLARELQRAESPRTQVLVDLPQPLWDTLYDGDVSRVELASAHLGEWAEWIGQAPEPRRSLRLLGTVAYGRRSLDPEKLRLGQGGDPLRVVLQRRGAPWATALAGRALAERVGVDLEVRQLDGVLVLSSGGHHAAVGLCGEPGSVPEVVDGEPVPDAEVLVRATLEALDAAILRDDFELARRLAVLAEGLDAEVAAGAIAQVDARWPPSEARALGRLAGGLLHPRVPAVPRQAALCE